MMGSPSLILDVVTVSFRELGILAVHTRFGNASSIWTSLSIKCWKLT